MAEYVCELPVEGMASFVSGSTTIPVMERIVRCRDCEHAQVLHPLSPITGVPAGIEDWRCGYFWNADDLPEVEPNGFCAWGKRGESE